jgi:endonuclease YncB( thermonuclease family)
MRVTRVIDGDTVLLEGGTRVRIDGVNAPEIDEELGLDARSAAVALVHGHDVCVRGSKRDHYDRVVADLIAVEWIAAPAGACALSGTERTLARELVRQGLAHVYLIPPVEGPRQEALLALEAEAREARRGLWSTDRYRGPFHITSFHANPPGDESQDLNSEYVRFANVSGVPQSLAGYTLANRRGQRYRFPELVVPPGFTVMVHTGAGPDAVDPARQLQLHWHRRFGAWSNRGDTASLLDGAGYLVDRATYDPRHRKVYPK